MESMDADTRQAALAEASHIAAQGHANAPAQRVCEEEVDAAIEEAIQHVRRHKD
jgi:hypothetical protein